MKFADVCRFGISLQFTAGCVIACSVGVRAQESHDVESVVVVAEGPSAALEFEKSFRDPGNYWASKPIHLDKCKNITELTKDLWSKKHVLTDFKKHRTEEQVGVIVFVKTEYCCHGSRLCAVTTACMEKKSTPLVGRFRVYAGWINGNPDHPYDQWGQWEQDLINEFGFIQGPGARIVVMIPTWDGKMYQWQSTASDLYLNEWTFEANKGETPNLESFLQTAIKFAPKEIPSLDQSEN